MTRSNDPTAGACPRCRKEIPLVKDSRGDLVLQEHYVVDTGEEHYPTYDVVKCLSSGYPSADALDDGEDWGWQPKGTAPAVPPTVRGPSPDAFIADEGESFDGMAIRRFGRTAASVSVSLRNVSDAMRDAVATAMADVEASRLVAVVLAAVRTAYIDATGAPPTDVSASFPEAESSVGPLTLALDLDPGPVTLRIAVDALLAADGVYAAQLADQAARAVRRQLRGPCGMRATVAGGGWHECRERGEHTAHICDLCRMTWTEDRT
ncbi:hypothetical protein DEJ49_33385 [Streptomyces venezuelae]|uniref:Uncharacterized protein n=1 Tax=Streptomyces venezuelae TaxID=54571 RepID=A0A5P2CQQ1_STRVZ|nr:hypothetical protein [Streptomyces venezuelae]QES45234.1 hypothetical protein DEJ49_33385 [Streptomyces venezuelae]